VDSLNNRTKIMHLLYFSWACMPPVWAVRPISGTTRNPSSWTSDLAMRRWGPADSAYCDRGGYDHNCQKTQNPNIGTLHHGSLRAKCIWSLSDLGPHKKWVSPLVGLRAHQKTLLGYLLMMFGLLTIYGLMI